MDHIQWLSEMAQIQLLRMLRQHGGGCSVVMVIIQNEADGHGHGDGRSLGSW